MKISVITYILVMAAVTYLIRALPLTLIRRPVKSVFVKSFLYYVPYVTLTVMTLPGILSATGTPVSALLGLIGGVALAWREKGLLTVALFAAALVLLTEILLPLFGIM